ncbi:Hypothetical_protein [Hexamita inflata]|nr:Hypothetical protein HINF_LOCUS28298 [Hexamita inflata]
MLSSILLIFKQVKSHQEQFCQSNLQVNGQTYSFCQKTNSLNTIKVQKNIYISQQSSHLFINTETTQQSQIDVNVQNINVNVFAVFGLNLNKQVLLQSQINVSLAFDVVYGALICITCDVDISTSTLVFIAYGKQLSGVLIELQQSFVLTQSFIQYRFYGQQSSGLVNVIVQQVSKFEVNNCLMTGTNMISSNTNGYLSSNIKSKITIQLINFVVCVNNTLKLGVASTNIIQIGTEQLRCDICGTNNVVYGLCIDSLEHGVIVDEMLQCVYPFEYSDNQCTCTEGYVLNITECVSILQELSEMKIVSNSLKVQFQDIVLNFTEAQTKQNNLNEQLDQRIHNNVTLLQDDITSKNNNINKQLSDIDNIILTQNTDIDVLQQQLDLLKKQLEKINATKSNISCNNTQENNSSYQVNSSAFTCSGTMYINTYLINEVTHQITSSNFVNGYAFSQLDLQNAFIDVQNNVFSNNLILFQNQVIFNNIQIQIGTQICQGTLLIDKQSISINQMNIISKIGCNIMAQGQLSVLQSQSFGSNISNLMINLIFSVSTGNIQVIGTLSGISNIVNYHVLGNYQSSGRVTLVAATVSNANINANNITFVPSMYNIGNESSYLFSIVQTSTITATDIAVILGTSSSVQILSQLPLTNTKFYFQYGGLCAQVSASTIIIQQVIHDTRQAFNSQFINMSGFIIGWVQTQNSVVQISQLCFAEQFTGSATYYNFGMIGHMTGKLTLSQSAIYQNVTGQSQYWFGVVGTMVASTSTTELNSIIVQTNNTKTTTQNSQGISVVIGSTEGVTVSIQNITVQNSNISGNYYIGGIISTISGSQIRIVDSTVENSIIESDWWTGGMIANSKSDSNILIQNSIVAHTSIHANATAGGLIGQAAKSIYSLIGVKIQSIKMTGSQLKMICGSDQNDNKFTISSSISEDNYINAALQQNCPALSNAYNTKGC